MKNPAICYLECLHHGESRESTRRKLGLIIRMLTRDPHTIETYPWAELRYVDVVEFRAILDAKYSPYTANRLLSVLKRVLEEAWRLGSLESEHYIRIKSVRGVVGERQPRDRVLKSWEVRKLLERTHSAEVTWETALDATMLVLILGGGLRRAEVAAVKLDGLFRTEEGQFEVTVVGKRNKERKVSLPLGVTPVITTWLRMRGTVPGPLLPNRLTDKPFAPNTIYRRMVRLVANAGLRRLSPHDGRATVLTNLLDCGVDLNLVAKIAGHTDVRATKPYDRRDERAMRRAINLLPFDFSVGLPEARLKAVRLS